MRTIAIVIFAAMTAACSLEAGSRSASENNTNPAQASGELPAFDVGQSQDEPAAIEPETAAAPDSVTADELADSAAGAVPEDLPECRPEACNYQQTVCECVGESQSHCYGLTGACVDGQCETWSGLYDCPSEPEEGDECVDGKLVHWTRADGCAADVDGACAARLYRFHDMVECEYGCEEGATACNPEPEPECPTECVAASECECQGCDQVCTFQTGECVGGACEATEVRTPCAGQEGWECSNNRLERWHATGACNDGECVKQSQYWIVQTCLAGCVDGASECNPPPSDCPETCDPEHRGAVCEDNHLLTWRQTGACVDGQCERDWSVPQDCYIGCTEGASECNPDPGCEDNYHCSCWSNGDLRCTWQGRDLYGRCVQSYGFYACTFGCEAGATVCTPPEPMNQGDVIVKMHAVPAANMQELVRPVWLIDPSVCYDAACNDLPELFRVSHGVTPHGSPYTYIILRVANAGWRTPETPFTVQARYEAYWHGEPNLPTIMPKLWFEVFWMDDGHLRALHSYHEQYEGLGSLACYDPTARLNFQLGRVSWSGGPQWELDWQVLVDEDGL